jgi:hypothetical protein
VTIPIPFDLLETVVDYLYTDQAPDRVALATNPAVPANVLVVADQLLIDRLKAMCEDAMVSLMTLKNVAEFVDFSATYNARQLRSSCFQFVSLNCSAVLESRVLESVGEVRLLDDLADYYKEFVLGGGKRRLTPYAGVGPTSEELAALREQSKTSVDEVLAEEDARVDGDGDHHVGRANETLSIKVRVY